MTSLFSLSRKPRSYSSLLAFDSEALPGVRVFIRRMSLARRIALAKSVRELAGRLEFHDAGTGVADKLEAARLSAEVNAVYIDWGVECIEGLCIDGLPATSGDVIRAAPEAFAREIVQRIKSECALSDEERKN